MDQVDVSQVPQKAEAALEYRQKVYARTQCKEVLGKYAECCRGRTLSTIWACREPMNAVNKCLAQYSGRDELNRLKRLWVEAGCPKSGWDPYEANQ
mmetsp:Transcript_32127/g.91117  ORF Transcript_32127/g.91117 Transcript_32127/m.91117 type:complete len:96 (-) Transcript_32127:206-493(-)